MTEELLPCPFCGTKNVEFMPWHGGAPTKMMASCDGDDCEVRPMVTGETPEECIKHWNTRAADLCAHDKPLPNLDLLEQAVKHFEDALQDKWDSEPSRYACEVAKAARLYLDEKRAALTNAKPVDHAPLRDVEKLKQEIVDKMGEYLDGNILLCQEHAIKFALDYLAALQPTVINKHDELLREARDALEASIYWIGWKPESEERYHVMQEIKDRAENTITKLDAALQPINQAEE